MGAGKRRGYPCPLSAIAISSWYGDPVKECTCSDAVVSRHQKRISGPLLDQADLRSDDIHMDVPRLEYEKLSDDRLGRSSTGRGGSREAWGNVLLFSIRWQQQKSARTQNAT